MEKILKRILLGLWTIYLIAFIVISVCGAVYGATRKWLSNTLLLAMLALVIMTGVYYLLRLYADKSEEKRKSTVIGTVTVTCIVGCLLAIFVGSDYFFGPSVEKVENIAGKKCLVVTYEGYGERENVYTYVNGFFRGKTAYTRDQIIDMQNEEIKSISVEYKISYDSKNRYSFFIDAQADEILINFTSGYDKKIKVTDTERLVSFIKEKLVKGAFSCTDDDYDKIEKRSIWSIKVETENEKYKNSSTYEYPAYWDGLWDILIETTEAKDLTDFGF